MKLETVAVGQLATNCYLLESAGELLVVDPGAEAARIIACIAGRKVAAIAITHAHGDHIAALYELAQATGAPVYASAVDTPWVEQPLPSRWYRPKPGQLPHVDVQLCDGDTLEVGECSFEVIETPGHTPGSMCLYCAAEKLMFTGDTVFAGGRFGRTDFTGGSMAAMRQSLAKLSERIPNDVAVLPGHDAASTMQTEKRLNPYM